MKRVIVEDSGDSGNEEVEPVSPTEEELKMNETNSENEDDENISVEEENENVTSDEHDSDNENSSKNSAWADAVSKILKSKPKVNKPLVLSKAKKLTDLKVKPKEAGFEVVQEDGEIKKELVTEPIPKKKTKLKEKKKKEIPGLRVKPDILEKDRERVLAKIATRGVVQLFNAVKNQQKDINKKLGEAGPLEVRKEKVLKSIDKNNFLDTLMAQKSQNVDEVLGKQENFPKKIKLADKEENSGKVWDVLRDNYMMDAKMKDWDKELDPDLTDHELEAE